MTATAALTLIESIEHKVLDAMCDAEVLKSQYSIHISRYVFLWVPEVTHIQFPESLLCWGVMPFQAGPDYMLLTTI
jgi:hypothetical protein